MRRRAVATTGGEQREWSFGEGGRSVSVSFVVRPEPIGVSAKVRVVGAVSDESKERFLRLRELPIELRIGPEEAFGPRCEEKQDARDGPHGASRRRD